MNNLQFRKDTIVAPATVQGKSAIAVVRMSGTETFSIIEKVFKPAKNVKLKDVKTHQLLFGTVVDKEGELIDEVLVSFFRNHHSYTGEDSVEISSHGSPYIQQKIIELLIDWGATYAQAGEFTMRAFTNGKIDLVQAEAVTDIITAQSEASHKMAMQQMRGGYSEKMKMLRKDMLHFISLIELELDFGEEDVEFADRKEFLELLKLVKSEIEELTSSFKIGSVLKNGVPVAIIGEPNVGKSTLLNALLNEEKAIVSDIPGTTRDIVEDTIVINGVTYRFIDTAGLRESEDQIEKIGIERALAQIQKAEIILYVVDVTKTKPQDAVNDFNQILATIDKEVNAVLVFNKSDIHEIDVSNLTLTNAIKTVNISAKHHQNIDSLIQILEDYISIKDISNQMVVSNVRHYDELVKAKKAIESAEEAFALNIPTDLIAIDIRTAIHHIGAITGEILTDEILGNIFGSFCIGK